MSRNLCSASCEWCRGVVVLSEEPRPITSDDCGRYFSEYEGMLVAFAHCYDCEAQYLAWIDGLSRHTNRGYPEPAPHGENPVRDLSFRSTFNDEFGPADFPKYAIKRGIISRVPWSADKAGDVAGAFDWLQAEHQRVRL